MVTELERIEYVEDPHLGKGSYCVVERHAGRRGVQCAGLRRHQDLPPHRAGRGTDTIVREIDEAIQALPEGYDTVCTDGMFSQGEWQLLSIARAAAADPAVLLLDEITANLDAETEARVREALRQASVGAPSSPFPTASMRVLAAGLWRSGPKDSKCRECSPGSRKTSGAAKMLGKETVDSVDGFCYDEPWSERPISTINGGECSWIAAEVQGEAGYAAHRDTDTGCGHP